MPEMCESTLQNEDIACLFADLAACTKIMSIQEKGCFYAYADAGPPQLETAKQRLLSGEVRAMQIRYHYEHRVWTDTLMRSSSGIRLVRCRHSDQPETPTNLTQP